MDKKYYLRNELNWKQLTEEQINELSEKGSVEIDKIIYTQSPRISMFNNNNGFVEMYEVGDNNVLGGYITNGVNVPTGSEGVMSGINRITMPINTLYFVRTIVSTTERYCNNRFFPDIVDAIKYFETIKGLIERK